MRGSVDPSKKSFAVIGAGFSGLLITYRLMREGHEVKLVESASRVGGLIDTLPTEKGMVETAAHSLLISPAVSKLFKELNVPLLPVSPGSQARFVYRDGKLKRWPLSFFETLSLATAWGGSFLSRKKEESGESLEEWAKAKLGQAALDYLVNPFVRGIYATSPKELNFRAAFPKKKAKKIRNHSQMMAPKEGMRSLIQALEERVKPVLSLGTEVKDLKTYLQKSNVILCTPAAKAERLIREFSPKASIALSKVRYSSLATLTVFCPRSAFQKVPKGVGFLVPEKEGRKILGILFNSSSFLGRVKDKERTLSLTVMMKPEAHDSDLKTLALKEISEILHADFSTLTREAEIFEKTWASAIPLYNSELMAAWEELKHLPPGILFFGNWTGQVSLRGMIESTENSLWDQLEGIESKSKSPL
jgi:oxygen-dependent protoporphyrinogen oxidase